MKDLTENYLAKSLEGFYSMRGEGSDYIINQIEFPSDRRGRTPEKSSESGISRREKSN